MSDPQQQNPNQGRAAALTAALIGLYVTADHILLSGISWVLRRTGYSTIGRAQVRRLTQQVVAHLDAETGPIVDELVQASVHDGGNDLPGGASGGAHLPSDGLGGLLASSSSGAGGDRPPGDGLRGALASSPFGSYQERAGQAIRDDLLSSLQDVRRRITRLDDDVYKEIAPAHAIDLVHGAITPLQAQAAAWKAFVERGITGFTDKSGRDWSLSAYVEMAVRTASIRAFNEATVQSMRAAGVNLVTVTHDEHPCPKCFPWQGRIIAIEPDGEHPTIEDAIAAGLLHPNCGHTFVRWSPSIPPPREWTPELQDAYNAQQRQRSLELAARKAKRMIEFGRSPEQRAQGREDLRDAQKRIRQVVTEHGLPRRPYREAPNLRLDR